MTQWIFALTMLLTASLCNGQAPVHYPDRATCTETTTGPKAAQKTTRTCLWGDFKSVSIAYEDGNGHLNWQYGLYRKIDGKYAKVSNGELFGNRRGEALPILNGMIDRDYKAVQSQPESEDCFYGMGESAPQYEYDEMGVEFVGDNVVFHVSYGLITSCRAVDGTTISLPLPTLRPFLVPQPATDSPPTEQR